MHTARPVQFLIAKKTFSLRRAEFGMQKKFQNWLVIGISKNWETALSQPVPIWGLKPRYQGEFQTLRIGDVVWFYITSPISGIIGLGILKDKYIDNMNLIWDEELSKKAVVWPLRFRIHVLKVISGELWKSGNIKINDFHLNWQIGFQLLQDNHAEELTKRSKEIFGMDPQENFYSGATITKPLVSKEATQAFGVTTQTEKPVLTHRNLQETIAEIGKLQFYHTQLEYPIELSGEAKNLDVVWKREISGAPTFAFEVELSGVIEKAIMRLKFAYNQWNSRPRIVVPKEFSRKVNNIIAAESKDFFSQCRMYEPTQLIELLDKKRDLRTIEQNLGIY